MKRTAAVILAAGASTRLGAPKQLVRVGSENLLERAVRIATESGCSPIVVLLGASADLIQRNSNLCGARVVRNELWSEGMASSIRVGIGSLTQVKGAIVLTCDMPTVTADHLRLLMETEVVMGSSYAGRIGVPAYFPESSFSDLMRLQGDIGARELLRTAASRALPGGHLDIDTETDLKLLSSIFWI